jgi:hypothetical protein
MTKSQTRKLIATATTTERKTWLARALVAMTRRPFDGYQVKRVGKRFLMTFADLPLASDLDAEGLFEWAFRTRLGVLIREADDLRMFAHEAAAYRPAV